MPQRKRPLRYFHNFTFDALCDKVERRFNEKLPPNWKALVKAAWHPNIAYFDHPFEKYDKVKTSTMVTEKAIFTTGVKKAPLEDEWYQASLCFACDPDLFVEIITFARKQLNELQYDVSRSGRVRWFFIRYTHVKKENGELRLPGDHDFSCENAKGKKLWDWIHVCDLQDKDIAALLFRITTEAETDRAITIVRQVRASLSSAISEGRSAFDLNTIHRDDEQWLAMARRKDGKLFYLPKDKLGAKAKKAPNR